jgi:hypothetical protein
MTGAARASLVSIARAGFCRPVMAAFAQISPKELSEKRIGDNQLKLNHALEERFMAKKKTLDARKTGDKASKKKPMTATRSRKRSMVAEAISSRDIEAAAEDRIREGNASLALASEGAIAALDIPSSPASCQIWRGQQVFQRIMDALSEWSQEPVTNISPSTTLGQLAKGTPWNIGQQARLVQATNARHVFAPFRSIMAPPTIELSSATTVEQWINIVWRQQTPRTFCFIFAS